METYEYIEARRLALQAKFEAVPGVNKAYFQPPSGTRLEIPCIVYNRNRGDTEFADDLPYNFRFQYSATVIYTDPDCPITAIICSTFPGCTFDRQFTKDNLYHDVLTLYD